MQTFLFSDLMATLPGISWGLSVCIHIYIYISGFPRDSAGKECTCNVGDLGLIPGTSGEGKGYPLQYDEMVGWHHRLNGHGFGWTPRVCDGQGSLACCGSWGHKKSDTTE